MIQQATFNPETSPKICVDLCSGLGGFSQAFVNAGWKVITVDREPKFKPTFVADITKINWEAFKLCYLNGESPDVLLASPPCNHFSLTCFRFPRKGILQGLQVVGACFEAVAYLKPRKWLIENPRGRLRHIIGRPPQTIRYSDYDKNIKIMKTTDFWGNINLPMVKGIRKIRLSHGIKDPGERLRHNFPQDGSFKGEERKNLPAIRALIPLGVSEAVLEACNT